MPLIKQVKRSLALIVRIVPSFLANVREKNFPFVALMRAAISSLVGVFCIVFVLLVGGESLRVFGGFVNLFFAVFHCGDVVFFVRLFDPVDNCFNAIGDCNDD